jgi:hypothetical protein
MLLRWRTDDAGGTPNILSSGRVDAFATVSGAVNLGSNQSFNNTGQTTNVPADLKAILGTVLTETAGLIAAGFKKFFNVASPTGTLNSLPGFDAGVELGLPVLLDLADQPYNLLGVYAGVAGIGNGSGAATSSVQTTQTATLARIIGLLGKNQGLRNITLDGNGNLLTADLCVYSSKANAQTNDGTTGLLYKYSIVDSYSGTNLASHVETEEV